jgi:hypothetical protein
MAEEMKGRVVGGDGKVAEVDGGYFGGTVSQPIKRNIAATAAIPATRMANVKSSSSSGSAVEILSLPCLARRAKPLLSSAPALRRVLLYMPMKPLHGMACMNDLRWGESITNKLTALTALARITLRNISAAYTVPRSAFTIPLRARICSAQESSWREYNRRVSNGDQVNRIAAPAMKPGKPVDFTGYWQRHVAD